MRKRKAVSDVGELALPSQLGCGAYLLNINNS